VTPLEFLREELENVERALNETLQYDYGPEQGREYYDECADRLKEIKTTASAIHVQDLQTIQTLFGELRQLSSWILLIERSHLGEFSWPFAEGLKEIANILLSEKNLRGDLVRPLIHVVAEGEGYQIAYEPQTATASSRRPFVVVAFQRSLKHHALFHSIFGHELGHTALQTASAGAVLSSEVIGAFLSSGPMSDMASINGWLNSPGAQQILAASLSKSNVKPGGALIEDEYRESWLDELSCDLFGLVLFGPAFLAAHRTYLGNMDPDPYHIDLSGPTHPPYAVRQKMLRRAMELLNWDKPITHHDFEREFLEYLLYDPYDPWAAVFNDIQLRKAISRVKAAIAPVLHLAYKPIGTDVLTALVLRLENQLPPILDQLDPNGKPMLRKITISQTLHAGWAYWIGQRKLSLANPLTFFETNRLCDLALLQQRAINDTVDAGVQ
jgi:hypothetical protein